MFASTRTIPRSGPSSVAAWLSLWLLGILLFGAPAASEPPRLIGPAEPPGGTVTLPLEMAWTAGGAADEEDFFDEEDQSLLLGRVVSVTEDPSGNIYLLDTQRNEIVVLSPEGAFLRSIGRRGEGPGEFTEALSVAWAGSLLAVAQVVPARIVLFRPDGVPAGGFPVELQIEGAIGTRVMLRAMQYSPAGFVFGVMRQGFSKGVMFQTEALAVYTPEGRQSAVLAHLQRERNLARDGFRWVERDDGPFMRRWAVAQDGTVYLCMDFDRYEIHAYGPDGVETAIFGRAYEPLERSRREIEHIEELFAARVRGRRRIKFTSEIEQYHRVVENVVVRPDGEIWVLTGRGRWRPPEGVARVYDVFDRKYRFIRRVQLPLEVDLYRDAVWVLRDRILVVTNAMPGLEDDESGGEETVEVRCYQMGEP